MNIFKAFIFTAFLIIIEILVYFLFQLIEPGLKEKFSLERTSHYYDIQRIIAQVIAYTTIFILFFKNKLEWKKGVDKIKLLRFQTVFFVFLVAVGLELIDRPLFDLSNTIEPLKEVEQGPIKGYSVSIFKAFGALIIAPLFEEIFYRKIIFRGLLVKYSLKLSILVSSVCFALVHLPFYKNLLPTFILGMVCCLIYYKTKNIFYAIILHFFANLLWLSLVNYGISYSVWISGLNYNFTYWGLFVLGICLTLLGLKNITTANKGCS